MFLSILPPAATAPILHYIDTSYFILIYPHLRTPKFLKSVLAWIAVRIRRNNATSNSES
jgi:hypothetical protein